MAHEGYIWVVTGRKSGGSYPGTETPDPLDGFRELRSDIEKYCGVFLTGSDEQFLEIVSKAEDLWRWYMSLPPLQRIDVD